MMDDVGKSDRSVVPEKLPNNAEQSAAEVMEGRDLAKGNTGEQNASRTQRRTSAPSALDRVRQAARKDRHAKFTALFHHVTIDRLRESFLPEELPALFAKLAALGCHDVSLLRYVGADASLELSAAGRERLAALIADAPLACRVSVCFGDGLPAQRLFHGADGSGDCGAGRDFITITPDQQVQSCSFQDRAFPAATAEEVLAIWRSRRAELRSASERHGCARQLPLARQSRPRRAMPDVAVWRGFSGNNSGECILIGKFDSSGEAERFLAELAPSWTPEGDYSDEWRALFERENVALTVGSDNVGDQVR
jgi:hypothetical protein